MSTVERIKKIVGWVLHVLIAGLMIFAGTGKVFRLAPEVAEGMQKYGLGGQITLIGTGELITAILLLIPRTSSLGVLLASSFWGGVICLHMSHDEPYLPGSVLLVLTWVGAYLRNPATFSSFFGSPIAAQAQQREPAAVQESVREAPRPGTPGRGVGGEGPLSPEGITPHPRPLSPEYRGEGGFLDRV